MEKKETYYGMQTVRTNINNDVFMLVPRYVTSGALHEAEGIPVFTDILGDGYAFIDSFILKNLEGKKFFQDIFCITNPITKTELLSQYKGTIAEAQNSYCDEMKKIFYIGIYSSTTKQGKLYPILLSDFLSEIKNGMFDDCIKHSVLKTLLNETEVVSQKEFEIDIKRKDLSHLMVNFYFLKGKDIVEFFNNMCKTIMLSEDLEYIYNVCSLADNTFFTIMSRLKVRAQSEKIVESEMNALQNIIDCISLILSSLDIAMIKADMYRLYQQERDMIVQIANTYDKYDRIFAIQMKEVANKIGSSKNNIIGIDANDMKAFLDKFVIGQEMAKKSVISAMIMNSLAEEANERTSCLLVGPTGSGKTLIAEVVGKYLNVPFEIIDTTQLTMEGYKGDEIESHLSKLIDKAGGDIEKAQHGVVVLDELDKKASKNNSDVSGRGVLNMLLPFLHGTDYNVSRGKETVVFNTSHLTIFATGSFVNVVEAKKMKLQKGKGIGFQANLTEEREKEDLSYIYDKLKDSDFVEYGDMTFEIMGRFTSICPLHGHTKESLKSLLTDSEMSPLLSQQKQLSKLGISLTWTEGYLNAMANDALEKRTGGRSLKSTLEESILDVRWEILTKPGYYSKIILTEECVHNPQKCVLIDNFGNHLLLEDVSVCETKAQQKEKKIGTMS